jgi:hypothetical protein
MDLVLDAVFKAMPKCLVCPSISVVLFFMVVFLIA